MTSPAQSYGIQRQDLHAAMAKAEELRALHAALMNGGVANSPAVQSLAPPFLLPRATHSFPSQDYPVFTPSYEDPVVGYHHYACSESQAPSETFSRAGLERERHDFKEMNPYRATNREDLFFQNLQVQPFPNPNSLRARSPGTETIESSRRIISEESKASICRKSKLTEIQSENFRNRRETINPSQETDPQKNRGAMLSRIFPRFRRKPKSEMSPNTLETEEMSQLFKDWGICSLETLKRELQEANENRDMALAEVGEMKSSMNELQQKLAQLENYCEELKNALKQATQSKDLVLPRRMKPGDDNFSMPVSHEAMIEGFLQIVSESRLSVRQFCKILITQIEETDTFLLERLEILLRQYNINLSSRHSKTLLLHFEAIVNRVFFEDFENCGFEKNGSPRDLDRQMNQMESFSAFVALRNLSSSKALRKGTKSYCEDFNRFCDLKMRSLVSTLGWSMPWSDPLTQSFIVAAKCVWLLHLLAFSFSPPLTILRVNEHRSFNSLYMEDAILDKYQGQSQPRVKVMVAPGFYVEDKVLKCKVLCRHKTSGQPRDVVTR